MWTWITRLTAAGDGPRIAVKDAIDVAGVPTTVGCKAIADDAVAAERDAPCLAGARAAGARLVGKANLHELCFGTTGVNPWFGTPTNPLDARCVPGGSSSGSAVAVATDEADVGYGTDTGGSVRIPAACCGVVGLKTTWGRISIDGVWPLAPSLDTIGPLARDVAGVTAGMALLDPGFTAASSSASTVGRVRVPGVEPVVDAAVDAALAEAEFEVVDISLPGWNAAQTAFGVIIVSEAWTSDGPLIEARGDRVGSSVRERLARAASLTPAMVADARVQRERWLDEVEAALTRVEVLALPTLECLPPALDTTVLLNRLTGPFNLSGSPAIAVPLPSTTALPASLQLVASAGREDLLCATAARVEAAVGRM